jgi:hypothetical protein
MNISNYFEKEDNQISEFFDVVRNITAGMGPPATYLKYLCDGWNLMRSCTWGLDAGESMQGAGGIKMRKERE